MLFTSWRNELEELINVDCIAKSYEKRDEIHVNSDPFYHDKHIDDDMFETMMEQYIDTNDEINQDGNFNENRDDPIADYYVEENFVGDVMKQPSVVEHFRPAKIIDDEEYVKIMRRLNDKQRKFVLHVLHCYKENIIVHNFLSGGAGVGKSEVVNATVQSVLRYASSQPTHNPESMPVSVGAPTGKAAFNVFGMTLHCIFKLPPSQNKGGLCDLESSTLNTMRLKFADTKLFIIDEISMVSVRQFYEIDQRLRQIFGASQSFGNKSVIVVGHLRQLPPVAGRYVFESPSHLALGNIVGNSLWKLFSMFELTEIMRQKGDKAFCKALNNMSEGAMDEEDIKLLRCREISSINQPPKDSIWLFGTNEECKRHNENVHKSLCTEGCVSFAVDNIEGWHIIFVCSF